MQIQALDRTTPVLFDATRPGRATHPRLRSARHATTLFAALEIATSKRTGHCYLSRHRHQEFLRFPKQVARAYPDVNLHLVMDNHAAHKRVEVRDWLTANPRIQVLFTPTSGCWLILVEVWFGIIEWQAIHRGTFRSVPELNLAIRTFIEWWSDRAHPFVWTKTAEQLLSKANRKKTSVTGHQEAPRRFSDEMHATSHRCRSWDM